MDSVRGVRIHCACGAIMKCKKLSASKLPFFFLLGCLCGVFTAPSVLQWILTCRYLAGHGALKNTMDSELRCRIVLAYAAIMSRHNLAGHDPLKNTKVFERRSRIASVYQVILTPCMSGRLIEVGKNGCWHFSGRYWFCNCASQEPLKNTMDYILRVRIYCVLQVAVTASRRPVKHNGF